MLDKLKTLFRQSVNNSNPHDPAGADWPFDQPRHCASLTMRQVLDGSEPILLVSHDADDHGWQFIGSTDASVEDGRIIGLGEIVARDPSVLQVADLPPGWQAVRSHPARPWQRRPHPPQEDLPAQDDALAR